MPGVMVIEALAQVGVILFFMTAEGSRSKLVYFSGIDRCRFRQPVIPGDQIRLEVTATARRGIFYKMKGEAWVDGKRVAEAEMSCAIVDRT